ERKSESFEERLVDIGYSAPTPQYSSPRKESRNGQSYSVSQLSFGGNGVASLTGSGERKSESFEERLVDIGYRAPTPQYSSPRKESRNGQSYSVSQLSFGGNGVASLTGSGERKSESFEERLADIGYRAPTLQYSSPREESRNVQSYSVSQLSFGGNGGASLTGSGERKSESFEERLVDIGYRAATPQYSSPRKESRNGQSYSVSQLSFGGNGVASLTGSGERKSESFEERLADIGYRAPTLQYSSPREESRNVQSHSVSQLSFGGNGGASLTGSGERKSESFEERLVDTAYRAPTLQYSAPREEPRNGQSYSVSQLSFGGNGGASLTGSGERKSESFEERLVDIGYRAATPQYSSPRDESRNGQSYSVSQLSFGGNGGASLTGSGERKSESFEERLVDIGYRAATPQYSSPREESRNGQSYSVSQLSFGGNGGASLTGSGERKSKSFEERLVNIGYRAPSPQYSSPGEESRNGQSYSVSQLSFGGNGGPSLTGSGERKSESSEERVVDTRHRAPTLQYSSNREEARSGQSYSVSQISFGGGGASDSEEKQSELVEKAVDTRYRAPTVQYSGPSEKARTGKSYSISQISFGGGGVSLSDSEERQPEFVEEVVDRGYRAPTVQYSAPSDKARTGQSSSVSQISFGGGGVSLSDSEERQPELVEEVVDTGYRAPKVQYSSPREKQSFSVSQISFGGNGGSVSVSEESEKRSESLEERRGLNTVHEVPTVRYSGPKEESRRGQTYVVSHVSFGGQSAALRESSQSSEELRSESFEKRVVNTRYGSKTITPTYSGRARYSTSFMSFGSRNSKSGSREQNVVIGSDRHVPPRYRAAIEDLQHRPTYAAPSAESADDRPESSEGKKRYTPSFISLGQQGSLGSSSEEQKKTGYNPARTPSGYSTSFISFGRSGSREESRSSEEVRSEEQSHGYQAPVAAPRYEPLRPSSGGYSSSYFGQDSDESRSDSSEGKQPAATFSAEEDNAKFLVPIEYQAPPVVSSSSESLSKEEPSRTYYAPDDVAMVGYAPNQGSGENTTDDRSDSHEAPVPQYKHEYGYGSAEQMYKIVGIKALPEFHDSRESGEIGQSSSSSESASSSAEDSSASGSTEFAELGSNDNFLRVYFKYNAPSALLVKLSSPPPPPPAPTGPEVGDDSQSTEGRSGSDSSEFRSHSHSSELGSHSGSRESSDTSTSYMVPRSGSSESAIPNTSYRVPSSESSESSASYMSYKAPAGSGSSETFVPDTSYMVPPSSGSAESSASYMSYRAPAGSDSSETSVPNTSYMVPPSSGRSAESSASYMSYKAPAGSGSSETSVPDTSYMVPPSSGRSSESSGSYMSYMAPAGSDSSETSVPDTSYMVPPSSGRSSESSGSYMSYRAPAGSGSSETSVPDTSYMVPPSSGRSSESSASYMSYKAPGTSEAFAPNNYMVPPQTSEAPTSGRLNTGSSESRSAGQGYVVYRGPESSQAALTTSMNKYQAQPAKRPPSTYGARFAVPSHAYAPPNAALDTNYETPFLGGSGTIRTDDGVGFPRGGDIFETLVAPQTALEQTVVSTPIPVPSSKTLHHRPLRADKLLQQINQQMIKLNGLRTEIRSYRPPSSKLLARSTEVVKIRGPEVSPPRVYSQKSPIASGKPLFESYPFYRRSVLPTTSKIYSVRPTFKGFLHPEKPVQLVKYDVPEHGSEIQLVAETTELLQSYAAPSRAFETPDQINRNAGFTSDSSESSRYRFLLCLKDGTQESCDKFVLYRLLRAADRHAAKMLQKNGSDCRSTSFLLAAAAKLRSSDVGESSGRKGNHEEAEDIMMMMTQSQQMLSLNRGPVKEKQRHHSSFASDNDNG
ncbi:unnamed protein product, partial [Cyprideis torosa]